jgi:predicted GH43/DUF377 family glycosyl hydrolase
MVVLLLLVAIAVFGSHDAFGQIAWTKDTNNPVLPGGVSGAWNHNVFLPSVLYNPDSARYEMWFGACANIGTTEFVIGFATSKDRATWNIHPTPVLSPDPGTWDEGWVADQTVVRENGVYKMWYTSFPSGVSKIGYATSADGITWLKDTVHNPVMGPGTSAWEAGGPDYPSVMPVPGGYKMWYTGWDASGVGRIGYATSADGITWVKDTVHNPVLSTGATGQWDEGLIGEPVVVRIGSAYYMWYSAMQTGDTGRSGLAISSDGVTGWTKELTNPLLVPSPGSWDASNVGTYSVLLRPTLDTLDMWYDGISSGQSYSIGHATSPLYHPMLVSLISPTNDEGIEADSVKCIWNKTPPATKYWFEMSEDSTFTTSSIVDSAVTDTVRTVRSLKDKTTYFWRVRAGTSTGWGLFNGFRRFRVVITDIAEGKGEPKAFTLSQNYPNPFNPTTVVSYQLPAVGDVKLVVYDVLGREVAILVNERKSPGRYTVQFNASGLASGVYFCRLTAGMFVQTRKMTLVR